MHMTCQILESCLPFSSLYDIRERGLFPPRPLSTSLFWVQPISLTVEKVGGGLAADLTGHPRPTLKRPPLARLLKYLGRLEYTFR
jgi:hypothetical protein